MFIPDRRILTHFDYMQPILFIPIILISFFLAFEVNASLAEKQFVYACVGIAAFSVFFLLPTRKLMWLIPVAYWVSIFLPLSTDIFGVEKLGAKRWLEIPFTHFTIQPSKIFKPSFILMLAYPICQDPPPKNDYKLKQFLRPSFFIILPFLLIARELDLGSTMVPLIVGFGVLSIMGAHYEIWLSIIIVIGINSPIIYMHLLKPYRKQRIHDFISEKPGYQVVQSMVTVGNDGLIGKSQDEATQTHFNFLSISISDFIFAYLIERFGFLEGFVLTLLCTLLVFHLLSLGQKLKNDYLARVAANYVALFVFIYATVNISMTIGFAPAVGISLLFFSYGGGSFTIFMIFFGISQHLITFRYFWVDNRNK